MPSWHLKLIILVIMPPRTDWVSHVSDVMQAHSGRVLPVQSTIEIKAFYM